MRIDAYNKVGQIYQTTNQTNKTKAEKKVSRDDKVEISQMGKDIHIAKQAIQNLPDVREDRVADIKKRMEAGSYTFSNSDIAEKLVETFFGEA